MKNTVHQRIFDSEDNYINDSYWRIHPLFLMIKNGETEKLEENLNIQLDQYDFRERISRDNKKQLEYMAVSLVNTFMIAAIQGGVYPPEANWIADQALQKLLRIKGTPEIQSILTTTALSLCQMVQEAGQNTSGNQYVEQAKRYITTRLTQNITIDDISEYVGLSRFYLSRLFKSMTEVSLHEYLINERISIAKEVLKTTDRSLTDIASLLQFCDQSHFTKVFREKVGVTPKQYRNQNTDLSIHS